MKYIKLLIFNIFCFSAGTGVCETNAETSQETKYIKLLIFNIFCFSAGTGVCETNAETIL